MADRAFGIGKAHAVTLAGVALVFVLDALSKAAVINLLEPGETLPLIPGVFHFTRMHNTGAAFSLFYQYPEGLTVVAGLFFFLFLGYLLAKRDLPILEQAAFSLILGGALGNLVDRIRWGAVTDFLDFILVHYPVFNLADSFIFIGVVLLIRAYVKQRDQASGI